MTAAQIIEEIASVQYWANARLREANKNAEPDSRRALNTSMALLPVEADKAGPQREKGSDYAFLLSIRMP